MKSSSIFKRLFACFCFMLFASVFLNAVIISEEDVAITEVFIDKTKIYDNMEIFYINNIAYVPFWETLTIFGFGNDYPSSKQALLAQLKNDGIKAEEDDIEEYEKTLYVSLPVLEKIISASISFSQEEQILVFKSKEKPFPIEKEWERNRRKDVFDARKAYSSKNYENIITGGETFQFPFIDYSGGYYYSRASGGESTGFWGNSAHIFGITGGWDSDIYYYDMNSSTPAGIDFKTSIYSPDGDILGVFKKVELGDIYTTSSPVSDGLIKGYGAGVSTCEANLHIKKLLICAMFFPPAGKWNFTATGKCWDTKELPAAGIILSAIFRFIPVKINLL